VFVYDRAADTNILITHSDTNGAFTASEGYAYGATISADGSTIAFVAQASDMFTQETANMDGGIFGPDDFEEVFFAKQGTPGSGGNASSGSNATIGLVSHVTGSINEEASAGNFSGNIYNVLPDPVITPDGKWIAYTSFHDDIMMLVAAGGYGVQVDNVYLFNADPTSANYQQNFLVSHQYGNANQAGDNNLNIDTVLSLPYMNPAVSDDGR